MTNDKHGPGVVRTYSGELLDIRTPEPDSLQMSDIAWCLGRMLRYNGGIRQDYTVAHHCLIMSHYVPPELALEALLHDAAEAYMGDTIHPVKVLYPDMIRDEERLAGAILNKFAPDVPLVTVGEHLTYRKSTPVAQADKRIFEHECFSFGDRPGTYHGKMQVAWQQAIESSDNLWHAPMYPFMFRYHELVGSDVSVDDLIEALTAVWYPERPDTYSELDDDQNEAIARAMEEL